MMNLAAVMTLVWTEGLIVLLLAAAIARRARRGGGAYHAGVVGAMYEWQNRDKQRTLQVIVNEKITRKRPEHPDDPPVSGTSESEQH
jgi:hypothetical protein